MSFLTPVWLLLGALAAYIFILHMRRRRQLDVPSVMIWRLMENNLTPHRALRWPPPSILLALQLIILVLVALALAQPLIGTQRGEDDHTIYVLDASASMRATDEAPSRFDEAKSFLTRAVEAGTEGGARVSIVTADARPRVQIARQGTPDPILAIVETLGVTDGIVDWNATASAITPLIQAGENTQVVVLTDGTDAGEAMLATLLPDADIGRAVFAADDPENVGLAATLAPVVDDAEDDAAAAAEADLWQVTGTVFFGSPDMTEAVVTVLFRPAGTNAFVDLTETTVTRPTPTQADIAAGVVPPNPLPAPFDLELELPGPGLVMLRLADDAGPADNIVRFDVRAAPVIARVLYIGDTTLPLLAALQSIDGIEVIGASALPADDNAYDLVVADNVVLNRAPATNVLWVGTSRLASQAEPTLLDSPDVIGWDADHPLSQLVDWTALGAEQGYRFQRMPGAAVLAESGGAPLVQARTTRFGREIRVAFDIASSGWANEPGFPVFVSHVVSWLGTNVGATIQPTCVVGEPCAIEARLLGGTVTNADGDQVWTANLAEGAAYLLPGIDRSFVPARAGYYALTAGDTTRTLTVNPVVTGEMALAPLESSPATVTSAGGGTLLWWPLLLIAVILLAVETWLAGRGSEQFLKASALARSNPLHGRRRLQLGLRIGGIAFLVAALAGLPWLGREPVEDTIVVMGTDLGTGEANPDRDRLIQAVNQNLAGGGRGGLIQTGEANRIAADVGGGGAALGEAAGGAQGTNLEDAMLLAAAMVPSDRQGRIVLATDGNETEGELAQAIATLQARGLVVDIEPVTDMPPGEVLVEEIAAPPRVYEGDSFKLDAVIYSQGAATADLVIRRAGEVIGQQTTELLAGRNRVEIPMVPAGPSGTLLIEVSITSPGDTFAENNANGVIVNVMPTPSILIVTPQPPLGEYFAQALSVQGLTAEISTPEESPNTIDGWLAYDSVIMMNVPAIGLDTARQTQLEEFVQLHGRGLLILGGEHAFGPGGYYGTPLERISPLSSLIPHEMPEVSIVYVIDRSGSMSAQVEEVTRLDIAKSSTMSAIGLLSPQSNFAIVVFDSSAYTLVPLQPLNLPAAEAALAPLIPGGGTNIYPGFEQALAMLSESESATKHIVIMTDGITAAADFPVLVQIAQDLGVTVSTIAIGVGDDERLAGIAAETGGEYYATADFQLMPSILAQETLMLAGSPFEERIAPVTWSDRDFDFLAGLPDVLPPVYSYVLTTAKPQADVHLTVADEEGEQVPLLASWRYGNGHVLALATHGAGAGTAEWIQMPEYPLMWAQVIRSFLPDPVGPGLNVTLNRSGDAVTVVADYLDPAGEPLEDRTPIATVTSASGVTTTVALSETTPGRYEGLFTGTEPGAYHVEVAADDQTGAADTYVAYPARFNFGRADFDKLQALAEATGGQLLLGDEPVFNNEMRWVAQPGWMIWALVALILFLADLTVRHAPNLFGLIRRRQRAPGPALAVPA
ncbi:MAG: VWA domain-containing protein [Bauldia sp.]